MKKFKELLFEAREISTAKIIGEVGKKVFDKTISTNYFALGTRGLFRYKDGNAYEVQIKPAKLSKAEEYEKFTKAKGKKGIQKEKAKKERIERKWK